MIHQLRVTDFQGIRSATINLGPYTFLFGANEAGKTSLAQAIEFILAPDEKPDRRRFRTNPERVRQGAKKAEVEVTLDGGATFGREQGRTGASARFVNGIPRKEPEFEVSLGERLGIPGEVISAALRSGALLDADPQHLLDLLMGLSRGDVDAAAIARELAPVADALRRLGLAMPETLAQMTDRSLAAVEARRRAKAKAKDLKADLDRVPTAMEDVRLEAAGLDALAIDDERRDLQRRAREAMAARGKAAGAGEERKAQLRARIAELEAIPKVDPVDTAGLDKALADDRRRAGQLEQELRQRRHDRQELEKQTAAADRPLPANADDLPRLAEEAEAKAGEARLNNTVAIEAVHRIERIVSSLQKLAGGSHECRECGHTITAADLSAMQAKLARNQEEAKRTASAVALAIRESTLFAEQLVAVTGVRIAREAVQKVAEVTTLIREISETLGKLQERIQSSATEITVLRGQAHEAKRYAEAQGQLPALRAQLAEAEQEKPQTPAEDLAPIEARLSRLIEVSNAMQLDTRREDLRAAIEEQGRIEKDADAVADACGPAGAQARLVSRAVQPFLDAANEALGRLVHGYTIDLSTDDGPRLVARRAGVTLDPLALSDGRRTSVLFVLQVAVAKLAKAPLVIFDRVELMDRASRKLLGKLGEECAAAGIQILALSTETAPAVAPPGFTMYEIANGAVARAITKETK